MFGSFVRKKNIDVGLRLRLAGGVRRSSSLNNNNSRGFAGMAERQGAVVVRNTSLRWGCRYGNNIIKHEYCGYNNSSIITISTSLFSSSSPFDSSNDNEISSPSTTSNLQSTNQSGRKRKKFIPPKAVVVLTENARNFFQALLKKPPRPEINGIMLNYTQSSSGEPRMVFSFDFVTTDQITKDDEGVSLEVLDDGVTPKPPKESINDGLPKLYVNHNALMKVLGCTLDVDTTTLEPLLYDKEGNRMDPNV